MNLDSDDTFEWINGFVIGRCYQFRALNYPERAIRHRDNNEVWLDKITEDAQFTGDSTWKAQYGRNGETNSLSFESINKPGSYVTHYGYRLYALPNDYYPEQTYMIKNNGTTVNFQSVNYPNHLIRHYGFRLRISNDSEGGDLYEADTNWIPKEVTCNP